MHRLFKAHSIRPTQGQILWPRDSELSIYQRTNKLIPLSTSTIEVLSYKEQCFPEQKMNTLLDIFVFYLNIIQLHSVHHLSCLWMDTKDLNLISIGIEDTRNYQRIFGITAYTPRLKGIHFSLYISCLSLR